MKNEELRAKSQAKSLKPELKYRAFYFGLKIIRFLESIEQKRATRIIADQLIRASTSIGANIIEAQGAASKKDFLHFFQIAFKSAHETKYWLALLKELLPNHKEEIRELLEEAEEICKIISSSILTMKGKRL